MGFNVKQRLDVDIIDITGIVIICIGYFIFTPILIYYLYRFIRLQNVSDIMKHRKTKLVYLQNGLSLIAIIFERLFVTSVTVWNFNNIIQINQYNLKWLIYICDGIFIWGIFILFFIKIWLLFYSIQYHQSLAKLTWKKELNPHYKSWYVVHKKSYGNFNFIIKLLLIPFILYIISEIYIEITIFEHISTHSFVISSLLLLIPSFILYCKLSKINDIFGIKKEIGVQILTLFIIMLLYITLFLTDFFLTRYPISYQSEKPKNYQRIEWLIRIFLGTVTLFSLTFISTYFPYKLHQRQLAKEHENYIQHQVSRSQFTAQTSISIEHESQQQQHSHGVKSMIHVLSDEKGFKGFMMHLVCYIFCTNNKTQILIVSHVLHIVIYVLEFVFPSFFF